MQADMDENSSLTLDTESVIGRNGITSSLTDMNQVPVFSSSFQNKKEQYLIKQENRETALNQNVFILQSEKASKDEVREKLFTVQGNKEIIRNEIETGSRSSYTFTSILLLAAAVIAVTAISGHRKRGRNYDNDNQPGNST